MPNSSRHSLCSTCKSIDFDRCRHERLKRVIQIGHKTEIAQRLDKSQCPFCHLVLDLINDDAATIFRPETVFWLDNIESWKDCATKSEYYASGRIRDFSNQHHLKVRAEQDYKSTALYAHRFRLWAKNPSDDHHVKVGCIQYLADREPTRLDRQFLGRSVRPYVDWSLADSWLKGCEIHHGSLCETQIDRRKVLPTSLRLVDVYRSIILQPDPDEEYVALSYVRGPMTKAMAAVNSEIFHNRNRKAIPVPKNLPLTIQDAILATQKLGYRYLWIDVLCIVQEDEADKKAQIQKMDAVYQCAHLTLVACSGNNADYGLPGISNPRKNHQVRNFVTGIPLASVLPSLHDVLVGRRSTNYPWNTRAWTLQEKLFSNKLLLFTDDQTYFRCCNAAFCEDTFMETGRLSSSPYQALNPYRWRLNQSISTLDKIMNTTMPLVLHSLFQLDAEKYYNILRPESQKVFIYYARFVEEFSSRTLTHQSDALRAISGTLNKFEQSYGRIVCGVPLLHINKALLWRPQSNTTCQPVNAVENIPSWSWAGWTVTNGGCQYESNKITEELGRKRDMRKVEYAWGGERSGIRSTMLERDRENGCLFPTIHIWAVTEDDRTLVNHTDGWTVADDQVPTDPSANALDDSRKVPTPHLIFSTTVLKFRIGKAINPGSIDEEIGYVPPDADTRVGLFELTDEKGRCAGEVWISESKALEAGSQPATLIALSWGYKMDSLPSSDYYLCKTLKPSEKERFRKLESQSLEERRERDKHADWTFFDIVNRPPHRKLYFELTEALNVMLVERHGQAWRRVAVGKVLWSAWIEAHKKRRHIILV